METNSTPSDRPAQGDNGPVVPHAISEFIRNNFRGQFLTDIHPFKDRNGDQKFDVTISHDDTLHHLHFNKTGSLLSRSSEPLIEMDEEEGFDYDD